MEDFVTFELAKKLKEKGFRENCFAGYDKTGLLIKNGFPIEDAFVECDMFLQCHNLRPNAFDAPTISQVLKWLREEKNLHVYIEYVFSESGVWICEVQLVGSYERFYPNEDYDSYEEAAIAGIEYVLDNLK